MNSGAWGKGVREGGIGGGVVGRGGKGVEEVMLGERG